MNKKTVYLAIGIGGSIGGYLPTLLGDTSLFSIWGVLGSAVGSFVGIYVVYKMYN